MSSVARPYSTMPILSFLIFNIFADQYRDKHPAGELASLIGAEDFRPAVLQESLPGDFRATSRHPCAACSPVHNTTAEHVENGHEAHKTVAHRDYVNEAIYTTLP